MTPQEFNETLWDFYAKNARNDLPWRQPEADGSFDPYKILVSEIMLQQTQVTRVIAKYNEWLILFPTCSSLAEAPLAVVLSAWSGLGYNRRAKFLHEAAKQVMQEHSGILPQTQPELIKLPGVGNNTAGAIAAYAYNQPAVFIETNIRTVFLFHFFKDRTDVTDSELVKLVASTIDAEHPREWYWALMDLGTYIKKTEGNFSKNSRHHTKQSTFKGSKREVRGTVLKVLIANNHITVEELISKIDDNRLDQVLVDLQKEGLIIQVKGSFSLAQ